jgi:hypothetical protein
MRKRIGLVAAGLFLGGAAVAFGAANVFRSATPTEFDPAHTQLVQAAWLAGVGCPTAATTFDGTSTSTYTDPACPTGDTRDSDNEGLLLAKTGPTANVASAIAVLHDVKGPVTELGYDIRKPGVSVDPRGSHCGAGAPRFNIVTSDGMTYFLGCNSPPAPVQQPGTGWLRLRWGVGAPLLAFGPTGALVDVSTLDVQTIEIVFDEGQDAGPDNFGAAILDNIDVNGQLVGEGATDAAGR